MAHQKLFILPHGSPREDEGRVGRKVEKEVKEGRKDRQKGG